MNRSVRPIPTLLIFKDLFYETSLRRENTARNTPIDEKDGEQRNDEGKRVNLYRQRCWSAKAAGNLPLSASGENIRESLANSKPRIAQEKRAFVFVYFR
ncbi:MAG: hypothetical protein BM485_09080 [Desulfobulbaceae bacterium DB1]|nr:MAG: hypothetical protein BM485_09080 [Desulfobulbaceae bacterium DB1]